MTEKQVQNGSSRRDFLKNSAALTALLAIEPLSGYAVMSEKTNGTASRKMNGIQIGAVSFVDEEVNKVLDYLQEQVHINTLFVTVFTYGRGLAGRQIPGQPMPDHGSQESDEKTFHGGNYAIANPAFYTRTVLKETRATEHGGFDVLAALLPEARKRGMQVFASVEDQWRQDVPGITGLRELDLYGRRANTLCLFHPDVKEFWTALVADLCSSYPVDGVLFFNERNGPFLSALGASHFQSIDSSRATCFCDHHKKASIEHGLDFERVKEGYRKLDTFVQQSFRDIRPGDGYYVAFQRLLLDYPEITAYDELFDFGKHQILKNVYTTVKSINKKLKVGFHIEHVNSFNPLFRATRSYEELAGMADFLKVVSYNNCAGERYASFIRNIGSTVFRDVPLELLMRVNNRLLDYSEKEASLDQLPMAGLSADTVFRETKRAVKGANGKCLILPGIDVNIPAGSNSRKASEQDTYEATLAAYRGGADGVILSRKYSEMYLANLRGAGRAIREGNRL
ncbi:MAG: twin-arginine translocation signal domain-containing protein [Tannerellaceae bacterium]|jgi:ASC-1-like (ASCH) protein|nr:twin-arginine translocation signal domain-containing protein [Tannerellaceae bacterium]